MSPDFLYFLRLVPRGHFGHTLPGLVLFCLPLSLLVLGLWHRIVKEPAAELLPGLLRARLSPLARQPFPLGRRLPLLAAAILLGALTHLVWDSATHADGWLVRRLPALQAELPFPVFGRMPAFKLAQHLSSLLGAAGLLLALGRWLTRAPRQPIAGPAAPPWLLAVLVGTAVALGFGYGYWQARPIIDYASARELLARGVVASSTVLWLALLLWGLRQQHQKKRTRPERLAS